MKKTILSFVTFVGIAGMVQATTINPINTINAPSSLIGNGALDGSSACSWGVTIPLASGQTVISAEVDFTSITLNSVLSGRTTGTLYTDLLNCKTTGVTPATDNDVLGDYWTTQYSGANIVSLGSQTLNVGATASWNCVLTSGQLASLNSYLTANNGVFNIGIDPDCHWSVGNIDFQYTLSCTNHNVPDAATTAFLMLLGLAALEVCRRQFGAVRSKA